MAEVGFCSLHTTSRCTRNFDTSARMQRCVSQLRAQLFGGGADGRAMHLDSLILEIAVYVSERGAVGFLFNSSSLITAVVRPENAG